MCILHRLSCQAFSPKIISVVASAHIHTQRPLKDLWKKSSLDNWPKGVFSTFSKGGNIKNQVSNYQLRALLLALGSGQCRTVLILGCLAEGGLTHSVPCPLCSLHIFNAAGWAERWGYTWELGMSLSVHMEGTLPMAAVDKWLLCETLTKDQLRTHMARTEPKPLAKMGYTTCTSHPFCRG